MNIRPGILIPLYNHGTTLLQVVSRLDTCTIPIIVVDDGSDAETKTALAETLAAFPRTVAVTLKKNSGKGKAVFEGMKKAAELGISHVLQIDSDGQHDESRTAFFFEMSAKYPDAVICGFPEFDESVPALRKNGRVVANTWTKIVTLSGNIPDSLCGFRIYPVEKTLSILHSSFVDKRMGFDPEILARLSWAGVPLLFYPVKVSYPKDGISHFRMIQDNVRISWAFTRLFFGMITRLPVLLFRKLHGRNKKSGA